MAYPMNEQAAIGRDSAHFGSVSTMRDDTPARRPSTSGDPQDHALAAEEEPHPKFSTTVPDAQKAEAAITTQSGMPNDPGAGFPEGGTKAWLCVVGGFFSLFVSFGWINAIGVFQDYYQNNILKDSSPSSIAWISSLETFMMFIAGPVHGKIFDTYGPQPLLAIGSFLHVFGLMMTSLSTEYYQFVLAQGICSPLGASAVYFPTIAAASTWFFHKRATALAIVASGSSLGGVIFPIFVQNLIPKIGFPWTMRASAFIILGLLLITNATVTSRLPPAKSRFKPSMLYSCFTERPFAIMACGGFLFFMAMFIPFNFLILQATHIGMDPTLSPYLISILNAASIPGRILPGYMADKLGRMNVLIAFCLFAGIITLGLWLPSAGEAPIVTYAVLYGFASGAFVALLPSVIAQLSPIKEIGVRNGNMFAAISVAALVGNPIAGALVAEDGGSYTNLQIFTGVLLTAGSLVMIFSRASVKGVGFKLMTKV